MGHAARAAVLRQRSEPYSLERLDLPDPGIGELRVRIAGVGMCHTDLLFREGMIPGDWPVVPGHEGAGVVEQVGPGVEGVAVGDHVVLSFASCGHCANCRDAHPAYCDSFAMLNFMDVATTARSDAGDDVAVRWFGQSSFASQVVVQARNAVVIGPDLPLELAGPLGCGFLTGAATVTNVLDVQPGDGVVVLGVGGVGTAALLAAGWRGAARVVAVDLSTPRLELARSLGATHAVDPGGGVGLTQAILATGGPVDHVFDTTGHPGAISAAVDALAARGRCALVANLHGDLVLGPRALTGGKVVTAVYEGDAVPRVEIPRLVERWRRGALPLEQLVTTYPLDAVDDAERDMTSGRVLKPVLLP